VKRFTETTKWADPWYRKLSPAAKLLWEWLTSACDAAGVIEPDYDLATFQIGLPVGADTLSEFGGRIEQLECGKLHIVRFVEFQVGVPSPDCKAHKPIFQSWEKHKIQRVSKGYPDGMDTVQDKDKDKDKDRKGSAEGKPPPTESEVMAYASGAAIPITRECALRWMTDRETADWMRPKGMHMLPVLPNWQADLRGYAQDWNKREDERRAKNGSSNGARPSHRIPTGV